MSGAPVIRLARSDDLAAVEALIVEAYSPYVARIGKKPGPMFDDYAALIADGRLYVAEDRAGIAGLVVLSQRDDKALLDNVAVANRVRGTGLGKTLIAHAEALALDAGFAEIILYTQEKMSENRAIYSYLGYRETYRVTEKGLDRVYFSKMLHP